MVAQMEPKSIATMASMLAVYLVDELVVDLENESVDLMAVAKVVMSAISDWVDE